MERLKIETIEDKLLNDLNMEKESEIDEIKNIEKKLEVLKIPKNNNKKQKQNKTKKQKNKI